MERNTDIPHILGQDYCEAVIDLNSLRPIKFESEQVKDNPTERAAFGKEIAEEAANFELSTDEIETQLGNKQEDGDKGMLSATGAVAKVFDGTSDIAEDYYYVAVFVVLWQKWIQEAHSKLTKKWPQMAKNVEINYKARQ